MEDKILLSSSKLISLVKIFHNRIGSAVSRHILGHGCKGNIFLEMGKTRQKHSENA